VEDEPGDNDRGTEEDGQEEDLPRRPVGLLGVARAEHPGRVGTGPHPGADAEPAEEHLDREGDGHGGDGLGPQAREPEDVDEVVEGHHQHGRDGGQAHFPEERTDGFGAKIELWLLHGYLTVRADADIRTGAR